VNPELDSIFRLSVNHLDRPARRANRSKHAKAMLFSSAHPRAAADENSASAAFFPVLKLSRFARIFYDGIMTRPVDNYLRRG